MSTGSSEHVLTIIRNATPMVLYQVPRPKNGSIRNRSTVHNAKKVGIRVKTMVIDGELWFVRLPDIGDGM